MRRHRLLTSTAVLFALGLGASRPAHAQASALEQARSSLATGDSKAARKQVKAWLRDHADDAGAWNLLGMIELRRDDPKAAQLAFKQALDHGFYPQVGFYNFACALALAGQAEPALGAIDAALDAGFADPQQLASDSDLASLHDLPGWSERVERATRNQQPCAFDQRYRAFDFWLGRWEVYDEAGTRIGANTIVAEERGCVLTERWEGVLGGTGRSLSYFDPGEAQWRQAWISSKGGVIHYVGGPTEAGGVALEGTRSAPGAPTTATRCVWTPGAAGTDKQGTVSQAFYGKDGSGSWVLQQTLHYRPVAD